jgi:hypothetical protein
MYIRKTHLALLVRFGAVLHALLLPKCLRPNDISGPQVLANKCGHMPDLKTRHSPITLLSIDNCTQPNRQRFGTGGKKKKTEEQL